jgi:hypothetical protein
MSYAAQISHSGLSPSTASTQENVNWSGTSLNLPPARVPSQASDVAKHQYFYQTLSAIQFSNTAFQNKIGALSSPFEIGEIILKDCKGPLCSFYTEESQQPQWSHLVYSFTGTHLLDSDGRPVTYSMAPDLLGLQVVHYIYFQVMVNPSKAYINCEIPV